MSVTVNELIREFSRAIQEGNAACPDHQDSLTGENC